VEFVDIAGLVAGASKGEGLGNKFLANIRETDAIAHVVRCFEDPNVVHVAGKVDPVSDIETINTELCAGRPAARSKSSCPRTSSSPSPATTRRRCKDGRVLEKVQAALEQGKPARSLDLSKEELEVIVKPMFLLTMKPTMYVANVSETRLQGQPAAGTRRQELCSERERAGGGHQRRHGSRRSPTVRRGQADVPPRHGAWKSLA
jgi:ribosome-binding ATPase YchF (GTP1/OBG family)